MQIEVNQNDYEISKPAKKNKWIRSFEAMAAFIEKNGGWKLAAVISGICYIAAYMLPSIPGQPLSVDQVNSLWATNFYHYIVASGTYYRWITANFIHFGFIHIAFNLIALYMLGNLLEKIWNKKTVFILFVLTGILANLGTFFIVKGNSAGASGGIFGLMGALLAFFLWSKELDKMARFFMLKQIGLLLVINLILGLIVPNIDIVGHLSGFVAGVLLGRIFTVTPLKKKYNLLTVIWIIFFAAVLYSFTIATIDYFKAISL